MGDFGDVFDSLYEKFLLRDLLSFITPGAIVVSSVLLLWQTPSDVLSNLSKIYWPLYIPIFGFLFMVGHAIQGLGGKFVPMVLKLPPLIKVYYSLNDRNSCSYDALKNVHKKRLRPFQRNLNKRSDWERKQLSQKHERLTALHQMCGNGFLAVAIAAVLLIFKDFFPNSSLLPPLATGLLGMAFLVSLYCGHIHSVTEQGALEDVAKVERKQPA